MPMLVFVVLEERVAPALRVREDVLACLNADESVVEDFNSAGASAKADL